MDDYLKENKATISQSFKVLEQRRSEDLAQMHKLQGKFEMLEEIEQHIKETTPVDEENESGK